ncbi:MAG TPA: carboxypeptidase-like regulatory domain-containing protein, partial [Planctomycetota bacterium]|nr:carboxypeptidase-like regulatory domain-containing protein [Planctomycetota bacterium]
ELTILGIGLGLVLGVAVWFQSQGGLAEDLPPDAAADDSQVPVTQPAPEAVQSSVQHTPAAVKAPVAQTVDRDPGKHANRTTGMVRGDIQLAVSVIPKITSMTVLVEEVRSAFAQGGFRRPHLFRVPIKLGVGTPTFEVTDIPFSEYPYAVSVYVPGLNGSKRTVTIDATSPVVEDIVLVVTPGAPFTLLVRDQDAAPYTGLEVQMQPVGDPPGRNHVRGTTDNFGSVMFEDMLAGDYQIVASLNGQPIGDAMTVKVQPGNGNFHPRVQGQGQAMTIPRGVPMQLQVNDTAGYGVADAKVTATSMERIKLTQVTATTNASGRAEFTHLTPGTWHFVVEKEKCERRDLQVTIKKGQQPEFRELQVRRISW